MCQAQHFQIFNAIMIWLPPGQALLPSRTQRCILPDNLPRVAEQAQLRGAAELGVDQVQLNTPNAFAIEILQAVKPYLPLHTA